MRLLSRRRLGILLTLGTQTQNDKIKPMTKFRLSVFALFLILTNSVFSQIYVAPDGNDTTNTGTIAKPFASIQKAQALAVPGDMVYIRGGLIKFVRIRFHK